MKGNAKNYLEKDSRNYSKTKEYDTTNGQLAGLGVVNMAIGGILVGCSYTHGATGAGKTVMRAVGYTGIGLGTAGIGLGIAGAALDHYDKKEKKDSASRKKTPCGKKQDKDDTDTLIKEAEATLKRYEDAVLAYNKAKIEADYHQKLKEARGIHRRRP